MERDYPLPAQPRTDDRCSVCDRGPLSPGEIRSIRAHTVDSETRDVDICLRPRCLAIARYYGWGSMDDDVEVPDGLGPDGCPPAR